MNICGRLACNGFILSKTVSTEIKQFSKRSFNLSRCTVPVTSFDIKEEKEKLLAVLPRVIEDLANHTKFEEIPVAKEWMKKVINGTVVGGKLSRGLTTVLAYKSVEKPENITEETIRLAQTLGWCNEFFQTFFVILDDIVDGAPTRRGQPSWHMREDVGMAHAINDSCLVLACLQQILRHYFTNSPIYVKLSQTFNENFFYVSIGQFLDIRGSQLKDKHDAFTMENYDAIVKHKCSYYTYKMPISIGLMLANRVNAESLKKCEDISFELGRLLQIQDDYMDCFGDETLTGKKGTDIQEGKCTWLAVNALLRCNAKNRAVFSACYGSKEPAHIERIKQLYVQLEIPQLYKQQERENYDLIVKKIESVPFAGEREIYRTLLDMIYERKK